MNSKTRFYPNIVGNAMAMDGGKLEFLNSFAIGLEN